MRNCLNNLRYEERGGATPTSAADRQQQQPGSQLIPPPPPPAEEGRGRQTSRHPTAPPSHTHARGNRCGLTVRQQQQQLTQASHPTGPLACHAYRLYRQCVAASQWAPVQIEQQPEGELITLSSRTWAAAPAAVRTGREAQPKRTRKPNKRRLELKKPWMQSHGNSAAAASTGQQQHNNADIAVGQRQQEGLSCSKQLLQTLAPRQQEHLQSTAAAAATA